MIKIQLAQKDNTIYEDSLLKYVNTGNDEILELRKQVEGTTPVNSRILLQFDLSTISSSVSSKVIPSTAKYYLNLKTLKEENIPTEYKVDILPVYQKWSEGIGRFSNTPATVSGSSWVYATDTTQWITGSYPVNVTGSFLVNPGGGSWYISPTSSIEYLIDTSDMRVDITPIVKEWLSGSINNNGLIIKRSEADEKSGEFQGTIQYFSSDSNTIHVPRLTVEWDDSITVISSSQLKLNDTVIYFPDLKQSYKEGSIALVNVHGRPKYPTRQFTTSSYYLQTYVLPTASYYSIKDSYSEETVIPFSEGTKLSNNGINSYFLFDTHGLAPERYYRFVIKIEDKGQISYFDEGFFFKVKR